MKRKRQKQLKKVRLKRSSRKSSYTKTNVLILALHLLLLILIYFDVRVIFHEINGWNFRTMEIVLPTKPERMIPSKKYYFEHIHYGQINIIIDGKDEYYLHFLDEIIKKEFDTNHRLKNSPIGLNADCLEWYSEEDLIRLLKCHWVDDTFFRPCIPDPVISFSLTSKATYGDLIGILDILTYTNAYKYVWTPLTEEAKQALEARKKEPRLYYW